MDDLFAPLDISLSAEQGMQMETYTALLREWNARINLVAASTLDDLPTRHILDCAQLAPHLPETPCNILDIGSGAGLPGIVLAILAPTHQYVLAEKVQKKAAFLHTAVQRLGLQESVAVHAAKAELLTPRKFDIITCRAWASVKDIVDLTSPLLAEDGAWLLLKGEAIEDELKACENIQQMTTEMHRSITNPTGKILRLQPRSTGNGYNPES